MHSNVEDMPPDLTITVHETGHLSAMEKNGIVSVCNAAFPEAFDELFEFIPPDGIHICGYLPDGLCSHAVITKRDFTIDGMDLRAAYVDAVSTIPAKQGRGYASAVMHEAMHVAAETFDIGGLSTVMPDWYRRLGWEEWTGSLSLRRGRDIITAPTVKGTVMIFRFQHTPMITCDRSLTANWRPGGGW